MTSFIRREISQGSATGGLQHAGEELNKLEENWIGFGVYKEDLRLWTKHTNKE